MASTRIRDAQAVQSVDLTSEVTNTLPVANGGTGNATNTLNSVLVGNGTGAVTGVAPGSSGNVLTSDGTAWTSTPSGGGGVTLTGVETLTNKTLTAPVISPTSASAGSAMKLTSGTVMTTPEAGALEYDGSAFYATPADSTRCLNDIEQFITITANRTLTSQTAAQKMFSTPTNGAVTLPVGSYFFECLYTLSSMAATSGAFGWALASGTATVAGILWQSMAQKTASLTTLASPVITHNTAQSNTGIVTANTSTLGYARIQGKVRISAAGTVIPQVSLGVAAAAALGADSYFRIWLVGSPTVTSVGNWS